MRSGIVVLIDYGLARPDSLHIIIPELSFLFLARCLDCKHQSVKFNELSHAVQKLHLGLSN